MSNIFSQKVKNINSQTFNIHIKGKLYIYSNSIIIILKNLINLTLHFTHYINLILILKN